MKLKHLCLLLLLIASNSLKAQDSLLIGKWQLKEMQQGSRIIFNRDSVEITSGPSGQSTMSAESMKEFKEVTHPMMKKMYYEFLEDGGLNAGVIEFEEGERVFVEKQGAYQIDGERLGLSVSGGMDTVIYSLEGNTLTLLPVIEGKVHKGVISIYERVD